MTLGNDNGTDGQTDGQTDRRTDRVRRNMRPPPREEGRIKTGYQMVKNWTICAFTTCMMSTWQTVGNAVSRAMKTVNDGEKLTRGCLCVRLHCVSVAELLLPLRYHWPCFCWNSSVLYWHFQLPASVRTCSVSFSIDYFSLTYSYWTRLCPN